MLLMDCFSPEQSLDGENVDFLPASVNDKLGERIVPFYYKGDGIKELLEFWDAHNEYHIDNKLLLFEQNKSTGLNRDKNDSLFAKAFRKADLFRLFGYDAVGVDGLRKRLQLEIDKYNLPVSLLQHDIDGDEISFSLENYDDFCMLLERLISKSPILRNRVSSDVLDLFRKDYSDRKSVV